MKASFFIFLLLWILPSFVSVLIKTFAHQSLMFSKFSTCSLSFNLKNFLCLVIISNKIKNKWQMPRDSLEVSHIYHTRSYLVCDGAWFNLCQSLCYTHLAALEVCLQEIDMALLCHSLPHDFNLRMNLWKEDLLETFCHLPLSEPTLSSQMQFIIIGTSSHRYRRNEKVKCSKSLL